MDLYLYTKYLRLIYISIELDTLKQAAVALEKLLASHGVTEDELFQQYRALKK